MDDDLFPKREYIAIAIKKGMHVIVCVLVCMCV